MNQHHQPQEQINNFIIYIKSIGKNIFQRIKKKHEPIVV